MTLPPAATLAGRRLLQAGLPSASGDVACRMGPGANGIYGPVTRNHMEWGYRPPGTGVDEPVSMCRLFWLP